MCWEEPRNETAPTPSSNLLTTRTVIGLITGDNETAYREEAGCQGCEPCSLKGLSDVQALANQWPAASANVTFSLARLSSLGTPGRVVHRPLAARSSLSAHLDRHPASPEFPACKLLDRCSSYPPAWVCFQRLSPSLLDDILIYSRILSEHQLHVRQVLQRLLENHLFVKKEKCEFHASQISFLGFMLKVGQVQADPEKVKAVTEWPTPTSHKLLQHFLGFANFYRRFIKNYSQVAASLTALTSPSCLFIWSEMNQALSCLKTLFTTAPVLIQPNLALKLVEEVDTLDVGVSTVLSQRQGPDSQLHPCACDIQTPKCLNS
ncbi:hypothetical protein L3Q82_000675 [Scortum barcoo]|uniref:Uncharacterized protein n=1 Tax=Scortum barcoo TaxID=214431 RepID=A0ACB8WFC1_9TELE|nr:hypothetical protein L3Q82_000675 [Scortum barcoo]